MLSSFSTEQSPSHHRFQYVSTLRYTKLDKHLGLYESSPILGNLHSRQFHLLRLWFLLDSLLGKNSLDTLELYLFTMGECFFQPVKSRQFIRWHDLGLLVSNIFYFQAKWEDNPNWLWHICLAQPPSWVLSYLRQHEADQLHHPSSVDLDLCLMIKS